MLELRLQARFAVYLCLSLITKLKGSANTDRRLIFSTSHTARGQSSFPPRAAATAESSAPSSGCKNY